MPTGLTYVRHNLHGWSFPLQSPHLLMAEDLINSEFDVQIIEKTIVRGTNLSSLPHVILPSNLDLLSGRFPVTYLYVYPNRENASFISIVKDLRSSLATTLNHYYPFAGRIFTNSNTGEPEIVCDNYGAQVVEAYANIPLVRLDFFNLNQILQGKLVSLHSCFPFYVQLTRYMCEGLSITFTFDHILGDAHTFGNFLRSWSEIAQGKRISSLPNHSRNTLWPRSPPSYDPCLDEIFISCKMEEILNMPINDISLKRLYHVDTKDIVRLQALASVGGIKRTKVEAFSAYVWKVMATSIDESTTHCKMGWLVDGRTRMGPQTDSLSNYVGNVLSVAVSEANVQNLKEGSLSDVAQLVHEAIKKVTNEAHFLDLIDWVECHKPGLMLAKIVLGRGGPALVLSSAGRFPVAELDFGFGSPSLGTVCSTINKIGTGYMNQRPSARGDGSWVVSAIIWPALAAALESDPDHVLKPMTANYLGL